MRHPIVFVLCLLLALAEHDANSQAVDITCGQPALQETHCYGENAFSTWIYQAVGTGTLRLSFTQGTIESATWDHLTIHDGTDASGPVLYDHVEFTTGLLAGVEVYSTTGSLYMVMTSDGSVSCQSGSMEEWHWDVVCLDCEIPIVVMNVNEDCSAGNFTIALDVTSTGSGGDVSIEYTVDGGPLQVLTGIGTGLTELGPFPVGSDVDVDVVHGDDPLCNLSLGVITDSGFCPTFITCGAPAIQETYCYGNSQSMAWGYQAVGAGTLRLTFTAGSIESSNFDHLTIYDGADASGTVLFDHVLFQMAQLAGIDVFASSGNIYMTMSSDGSVSCQDQSMDQWDWTVVCLDCELPQVTSTILDDCDNNQFSIQLDITSIGDAGAVDVEYAVNDGSIQTIPGQGIGTVVLGPFAINDTVNVVVAHDANPLCDRVLGDLTDTGTCPTLIECANTFNEYLCHGDNMVMTYYYMGTEGLPIYLFFTAGILDTWGDFIYVYDGPDEFSPILYEGNNLGDLAGLLITSTNPENRLTLRIVTDSWGSCQNGAYDAMQWDVGCYNCSPPVVSYQIVQDCENAQYYVDVNFSALGSDQQIEITNTGNAPEVTVTAPGSVLVGPFETGIPVNLTLVSDENSLCNVYSPTLVNPVCPVLICGTTPVIETYCYGPLENMAWSYTLPSSGQIRLVFNRGTIESSVFDVLRIFDGQDDQSPLLFEHSGSTSELGPVGSAIIGPGSNYYAVDVTSTGQYLYMTLTSDGSVECSNTFSSYDAFEWQVFCVGCEPPGIAYTLVPDCEHLIYKAQIQVSQLNGPNGFEISEPTTGQTYNATQPGMFVFQDYALDSTTTFYVVDLDNPGCTYEIGPVVYTRDSCVINSCGVDNYTLCYEDDEDRWYTYRADANVPVAIYFHEGQMLPGDQIIIYNGLLNTGSNVIYQGNNGGNLAGVTANSANPNNALTLRIRSNTTGSCADEQATIPLRWDVGCGFVGIGERAGSHFNMYPNPSTGMLTVDLGDLVADEVTIRVLDMSGRMVHVQALEGRNPPVATMDLSKLQNGQYLVQVTSLSKTGTLPLQIMR